MVNRCIYERCGYFESHMTRRNKVRVRPNRIAAWQQQRLMAMQELHRNAADVQEEVGTPVLEDFSPIWVEDDEKILAQHKLVHNAAS